MGRAWRIRTSMDASTTIPLPTIPFTNSNASSLIEEEQRATAQKAAPHSDGLRDISLGLIQIDHTKRPCQIVVWTGGEEELVGPAVACRASAELNPPELVDGDILAVGVFNRAHELSGFEIKCVDGARVRIVRDQQRVAQRPKVLGRHGEPPGLVQWRALSEYFYERPVLLEDVDLAAGGCRCQGEGYIEQSIDVLNAEGPVTRG